MPCSPEVSRSADFADARRGNTAAESKQRFDRRVSLEFERASTPASRPATSSAWASDEGISFAARRENFKKERYELQLHRSLCAMPLPGKGSRGGISAQHEGDALETQAMPPELFLEEVGNVNCRIEDLAKCIRFEHLGAVYMSNEDNKAALREAERRQREAGERRARKREAEARDPKRKVAIRLEKHRRFDENEKAQSQVAVPMQVITAGFKHNVPQTVSVVDVGALRHMCLGLDSGGISVESLLETQKLKERQDRLLASAHASRVISSLNSTSQSSSIAEVHVSAVAAAREIAHVNKILHRLASMRNQWKCGVPFDFDVVQDSNPRGGPLKDSNAVGSNLLDEMDAHSKSRSLTGSPSSQSRRLQSRQGTKMTNQTVPDEMAESKTLNLKRDSLMRRSSVMSSKTRKSVSAGPSAKLQRTKRRMDVFKFIAQTVWLFHRVSRKRRAAELIKMHLSELGEWARIRTAIQRLMDSLKKLQRACRTFQSTKRRRTAAMEKEWQRVEDNQLSTYFKVFASKIMEDRKSEKEKEERIVTTSQQARKVKKTLTEREQQEVIKYMEAGMKSGSLSIDWKTFRIPVPQRRAVISRYYMQQLKKHVRDRDSVLLAVRKAVNAELELSQFLRLLGADESQIKDRSGLRSGLHDVRIFSEAEETMPRNVEFYVFPEDTILSLISLTAQSLAHVDPFQDHPANRDLASDEEHATKEAGEDAAVTAAAAVKNLEKRGIQLGRMMQKEKRSARAAADNQSADTAMNVEELFRSFEPRLAEISQENGSSAQGSELLDPAAEGILNGYLADRSSSGRQVAAI